MSSVCKGIVVVIVAVVAVVLAILAWKRRAQLKEFGTKAVARGEEIIAKRSAENTVPERNDLRARLAKRVAQQHVAENGSDTELSDGAALQMVLLVNTIMDVCESQGDDPIEFFDREIAAGNTVMSMFNSLADKVSE